MLEKISKIIKYNFWLNTTMPFKPYHEVPCLLVFWILPRMTSPLPPWEPVPTLNYSFSETIFPNTQPKPLLAHFDVISPWLWEEIDPHLATNFHGAVESNKVSPEPPLLHWIPTDPSPAPHRIYVPDSSRASLPFPVKGTYSPTAELECGTQCSSVHIIWEWSGYCTGILNSNSRFFSLLWSRWNTAVGCQNWTG